MESGNTENRRNYWIIRTTKDVYDFSIQKSIIFAHERILYKFKNIQLHDLGVFYVSKRRLNMKSQRVQEFRNTFEINSNIQNTKIYVPTLPTAKQPIFCRDIKLLTNNPKKNIKSLIWDLDFIKRPEHWGSYLMQPFIKIGRKDFIAITDTNP